MSNTLPQQTIEMLARAFVANPRATLDELASSAGISRATLYRSCKTREQLINLLCERAIGANAQVVHEAEVLGGPALEFLHRLIEGMVRNSDLSSFLFFHWRSGPAVIRDVVGEFERKADAFFLAGQKEGLFRIDISAAALTELYISQVFGLIDAQRRGRLAAQGLEKLIETSFLRGVLTHNTLLNA